MEVETRVTRRRRRIGIFIFQNEENGNQKEEKESLLSYIFCPFKGIFVFFVCLVYHCFIIVYYCFVACFFLSFYPQDKKS